MLRPFPYVRVGVVTLFVPLLLSGCVRSPVPDLGVQALHNQVEKRSFHQAESAFLRADYSAAIELLNRFIRHHPQSSRSLEARWWLARAYQETGKLSSAVEQFRMLAGHPNPYQREARLRVTQLADRLGESVPGSTLIRNASMQGMLISSGSVQTPGALDAVLSTHQAIKGSMILLDVPCDVDGHESDNRQPFSLDTMRSAIRHLHAQGIAVYLGVTLRCLGHVARDRRDTLEHLKDWVYDPQSGRLRRSRYYSLHFGNYRTFLVEWISQLRDLPLAGLVIRHEAHENISHGIYEGLSPLAVRRFAKTFGVQIDPARMFHDAHPLPAMDADSGARLSAVFWKWAGWKARERLRILRHLVQALQVRLPRLQFGIEVRLHSVRNPVHGLMYFAEDWVEIARGPFEMFFVMLEHPDPAFRHVTAQGVSPGLGPDVGKDRTASVRRMVRYLGAPEKIWVLLPGRATHTRNPSWRLPEGVGRLYDHRVLP